MPREVTVFAPATVSNVACGFDIMGFAVNGPGDVVTVRKLQQPGEFLHSLRGDDGKLPREPSKNTAGIAVIELTNTISVNAGVEIELQKNMPLGSGLGSSAASAVSNDFSVLNILNIFPSSSHFSKLKSRDYSCY